MADHEESTPQLPLQDLDDDEVLKRLTQGWWHRPGVFAAVLAALGDAFSRTGEYEKALACDRALVKRASDDPVVWYNLACSLCRLGEVCKALAALKMAVACGYEDWDHLMQDEDLAALRDWNEFVLWWSSIR